MKAYDAVAVIFCEYGNVLNAAIRAEYDEYLRRGLHTNEHWQHQSVQIFR